MTHPKGGAISRIPIAPTNDGEGEIKPFVTSEDKLFHKPMLFHRPMGLNFGSDGSLCVAASGSHRIYEVTPYQGDARLLAGGNSPEFGGFRDGPLAQAAFNYPLDVAKAKGSFALYVADTGNHAIRKVDFSVGEVSTLAGTNSPGFLDARGEKARFNSPAALVVDELGIIYVADEHNHCIRKIDLDGNVTTLAGGSWASEDLESLDGTGDEAWFQFPRVLTIDALGVLYALEACSPYIGSGGLHKQRIRKITPSGEVSTLDVDSLWEDQIVNLLADSSRPGRQMFVLERSPFRIHILRKDKDLGAA